MLYTLIVKPIALGLLGLVVWVLWHAVDHLDAAAIRRHRRMVGAGGIAIALLVLGPGAWTALRDRPGEVAAWAFWLAAGALAVWGYARLVAAARRRAGRGQSRDRTER